MGSRGGFVAKIPLEPSSSPSSHSATEIHKRDLEDLLLGVSHREHRERRAVLCVLGVLCEK